MREWIVGRGSWVVAVTVLLTLDTYAQTPQPFPRAGQPAQQGQPPRTAPPPSTPSAPVTAQPQAPVPTSATAVPTAATLGLPVFPSAQFLTSYEAGRGQRFYIFGSTATYAEIVAYYKTQLSDGGDVVFREPATHMFNVGRFRQETMAFPPGVTVKDWTWGGSQGYPNPAPGGQPARFPTIVMLVPPPPAAPAAR